MKNSKTKQKEEKITLTRRHFVKNSFLAAGLFTLLPRHVLGRGFVAPSDKINLGYIGLGKQGGILANRFLTHTDAQIVAGAEVWASKRKWFTQLIEGYYAKKRGVSKYKGVRTYLNYQELLQQDGIDAVIIATPDNWHAIQAIDAMKSGKDVFCEKPMTKTIEEGRSMVNVLQQYDRVLQVGSMQRSWAKFIKANEIVKSGKLGKIKRVLVNVGDPFSAYDLPFQETPDGVDWNLWCGPSPLIHYHDTIAPEVVNTYPAWRDFKEIGGGRLADWGTHMFDVAQWCLGMDRTGPVSFIPPTNPNAVRGLRMIYENGIELIHEDFGRGWAVRFIGTEGRLDVSRSFIETTPSSILNAGEKTTKIDYNDQGNHYQNWLDAIKSRQQPICNVEVGHRSASLCHIANIAYELNRPLQWNPEKERFKADFQANKMRKRKNRKYV